MSRTLELSTRLRMVADLLPEGGCLADIGTDHAYLPSVMLMEGKIARAIAADLRHGPLDRARETVRSFGLQDRVNFCLCNGLAGIAPNAPDSIAIAGMGGETISGILQAAPWVRERDIPVVVQPMSSMPDLRQWLQDNGYCICREELCREGETIYTAMLIRRGEMPAMTPAECWAGRNENHPLRGAWLEQWLARVDRALDGLEKSRSEESSLRAGALRQVRSGLMEMKEEWDAWQR